MRRRDKNSTPSSSTSSRNTPDDPGRPLHDNAFTRELFAALHRREPEPVVPEGELPGPWRVTRLWGDGPPLWAVYGLGERGPRVTFYDAEGSPAQADLSYLTAAALHLAERPRRFRF